MILFPTNRVLCGVSVIMFLNVGNIALAQETTDSSLEQLNPNPNPLYLPNNPEQVELGQPQPLTLEQALELAQRNNRELQIARETLQRSTFALKQARAALLPRLGTEIELSSSRDAKDAIDDLEDGDAAGTDSPIDGRVEVTYDVYTSGRRQARIKAAEEQVRLESLEVERTQKQINLEVSLAYYELQETAELVRIAQVAVQNAEITLRDAQLLEAGEIGSRFDVIRAEVQLANAQQQLTDALTEQDISRRQLVQLLSLAESANIIPSDPIQPKGTWDLSLDDSIILAYENRVELQQQIAQIRISEQQRRIALSEVRPQLSLFAGYQLRKEFESDIELQDGYMIGTRLRWDFYDGGAASAAAAQEKSNQTIAQTRFADTRNRIRLQVERAYKRLQASAKNIQTATFAFKQARESLTLARLRFQAGVGIQLDVLTAENELTRTDSNRVRAILNYNRAIAELQRAVS